MHRQPSLCVQCTAYVLVSWTTASYLSITLLFVCIALRLFCFHGLQLPTSVSLFSLCALHRMCFVWTDYSFMPSCPSLALLFYIQNNASLQALSVGLIHVSPLLPLLTPTHARAYKEHDIILCKDLGASDRLVASHKVQSLSTFHTLANSIAV